MLHVTGFFDAGDIDKFNNSPTKTNNVYHSKRRFPSPHINMHYHETHKLVGASSGSEAQDNMRFRTTQRD